MTWTPSFSNRSRSHVTWVRAHAVRALFGVNYFGRSCCLNWKCYLLCLTRIVPATSSGGGGSGRVNNFETT